MVRITLQFDFDINLVSVLTLLVGWGLIVLFAYRIYRKQVVKPKLWKIILVLVIGLFAFMFNMKLFDSLFKFPVLPLGVWILYFLLKSKEGRWEQFRRYAWLGFCANFLFLGLSFASIGAQQVVYPPKNLSTYFSDVDKATIINVHPSSKEVTFLKETFMKELPEMKETEFFSDVWYEETYLSGDPNTRKERFPYHLLGVQGKWGSGFVSSIFLEEDGKGVLIATPTKQYYFRSSDVFLEGVGGR